MASLFWVILLAALGGTLATPVRYDTIVVGLGSAGTTAATTLARAGRRVLALEAQDRVGGRVWTRPFGDGVVEIGAEWIHGLYPSRVYDLAVQNNVSVILQDESMAVYRSDGSGRDDTLTTLLEHCFQATEDGSDRDESMGQLVERKLREYLAEKRPELLEDSELLERLLALMDQVVNTVEASPSFHDVTAGGPYERLNGSLYGSWHRHGYHTFFEILLNTYNGGPGLPTLDIKLNQEVTSIQWGERGVAVSCRGGESYSAENVIVTVSLGVLKERHPELFSPPLPPEKVEAIESISMGVLDKVVLALGGPWLMENVMFYWSVADVASLPQEARWVSKVAGISRPAGSNDTVTLWLAGDSAKLEESLPEEEVQNRAVELLQRFLGAGRLPPVVGMLRSRWFSNPFTRGSYSYNNMESSRRPGLRAALAAPLLAEGGAPRVLFAGEATHSTRFATVHGASDSGYREAQRLLAAADSP